MTIEVLILWIVGFTMSMTVFTFFKVGSVLRGIDAILDELEKEPEQPFSRATSTLKEDKDAD